MKMKKLNKGERGFTLIEMLMVITLVGLMSLGITAAISQLLTINSRSSNHMIAVRQVQQAGKEVSKDALQAQIVTPGENSGFPLTLTWDEWGTNDTHEVIYTLGDMLSGELKILWREHKINEILDSTTNVAEYINPAPENTYCNFNGDVLTFTVTATVGGQSETRVYEIEPRPD